MSHQAPRFFVKTLFPICLTLSCASVKESPQQAKSTVPSAGQAALQTANQYAKDGLLREAIDSYKKALQKDKDNPVIHRNLGIVLFKAQDFAGAIEHLEEASTTYQQDFDTHFYLGEAYRATEKYAEALFRYKLALKILPNEVRGMKSIAWTYYKVRFYSEALQYAQKLQTLAPGDDQVPIIVSRVLLKLKRQEEALKLVRAKAPKAGPSAQAIYLTVEGEALFDLGKFPESEAVFRRAIKDQPLLSGALLGLGKSLLMQGQDKAAEDFLERALRVKPSMSEGHYYLGRSLEKTNPQRALKHYANFRKATINDPEFVDLGQDSKKRITSIQMQLNDNGIR